jgi:hypothetical protein
MAGKNKFKDIPKKRNENAQALQSSIFRKQVMPNKKKETVVVEDGYACSTCGDETGYSCYCYLDYEEDLDDG